MQTLSCHDDAVISAVFSADGSCILTASYDTTANLWNIATGECTHTLAEHEGAVYSAMFSADGSSGTLGDPRCPRGLSGILGDPRGPWGALDHGRPPGDHGSTLGRP